MECSGNLKIVGKVRKSKREILTRIIQIPEGLKAFQLISENSTILCRFRLSSDTDIRNIVDQWKRNDTSTGNKGMNIMRNDFPNLNNFQKHHHPICFSPSAAVPDSKYFDTRTFTRPKKKSFTAVELNGELNDRQRLQPTRELDSEPKIDLQIGGLVTSRSFLGDCSPPPHMDASIGNSLITSSDFSNVNDFFNGADDSLSMTHFKQYRLADVVNDRNFLERLSNYDASLFTKDNDINDIDANNLIDTGNSSSSTLQNSTDSSNNQSRNDDTFTGATVNNGTFEADAGVDRTFIHVGDDELNGSTNDKMFECDNVVANETNGKNRTFEAKPTDQTRSNLWNQTVDLIDDEELSLCGTFTFNDFKMPELTAPIERAPLKNIPTPKGGPDGLESTPARQRAKKSRESTSLASISPIVLDKSVTPQTVDKFVDIEIEDEVPKMFLRPKETNNSMGLKGSQEKERRSLANFEEFEKSLLILENQNEEEFDDLLNSFSPNIRNPLSDKVRQSLDNIKKRHSMIGAEKQQEDELSREKTPKNGKYSGSLLCERNRSVVESQSPAMVSSTSSVGSGSGERLLRRSRVFDDALSISGTQNDNKEMDNLNTTTVVRADEQQSSELNTTEVLNQKNLSHLDNETNQKTEDNESIYNTEETASKGNRGSKNRDRFKTIRIFKKPSEDAAQLPDADETFVHAADAIEAHAVPMKVAPEAFASKNRNSPFKANHENMTAESKAINTMTFKKSALARPRQLLHGLQKRDLYAKSSSHEMLSTDEHSHLESTFTQPKAVSQLKSPMGFKSKSVHNLLGAKNTQNNGSFEKSSLLTTQPSVGFIHYRRAHFCSQEDYLVSIVSKPFKICRLPQIHSRCQ